MISFPLRVSVLALSIGTCLAEDATLAKNTVMRADHSLISLKAGTVVEVVERGDKTISVRYKGQTGTIPATSLTAAAGASVTPAPATGRPAAPAAKPSPTGSNPLVVDQPKSFYGNVVKKAETNAAKHDDNLVKPANGVVDDAPSK